MPDIADAVLDVAFGSSTCPVHEVVQAQWVAERRGLGRFVTEQPPYSILVRGIAADLARSPSSSGWVSSHGARSPAASSARSR